MSYNLRFSDIFTNSCPPDDNGGPLELTDAEDELFSPPFDIPCEVPVGNAARDLVLRSHLSFASALRKIAKKMDVSPSHLVSLGYTLSFAPKNPKPKPKLLENEEAWNTLKDTIKEFRAAAMAKNKGKGKVPRFHVILVDTAGPGTTAGSSSKAKKVSQLVYFCTPHLIVPLGFDILQEARILVG